MTETEVLEGEATEVEPEPREIVPAAPQRLAVVPDIDAGDLVKRLDTIKQAAESAMKEGVDFGTIPGTDKPALMKPGAEKLGVLFQLDVQLVNEKVWGPGDHLTVLSRATVYHAPTGARLGYGEGVCTSREKKYAVRKQNRTCPTCGAAAIIKGKAEYGGGWLCWKKRDGCGAKFSDGNQEIEGQQAGEIENPDLPDTWNTVVKMAEKRARVDAVLAVTGASALFTQDIDEQANSSNVEESQNSLELATDSEQAAAKQALGRLVDRDLDRAAAIYSETTSHFGGTCPRGLTVLLRRLDEAPA